MIRQHAAQLVLVFGLEQVFDRPGWQLGERRIGRRKHRERSCTLQGLDQPCRLERRRQCLERTIGHRRVDDIL